jgi:hypothetical protein
MFSKYTFWVKTTSVFHLLTASIHSVSLFTDMKGADETEEIRAATDRY